MGSLSNYVNLAISQNSVGVTRAGFGTALILSCNATFPSRTRSYADLGEVADDFATTSPEYLAAQALFAQDPAPPLVKIGRAAGQPTQRYKVTVSTVEHSHTYKLTVAGEGVTTTEVEYAADSGTTDGEIAAGLVAALNLVTGKNFTASGASSPISITGDAAGDWFSVESTEVEYLKIVQDHDEPATTLATDLNAIVNEDNDWYSLITLYNSNACILAAAAWIESVKKIYLADTSDSESVTLAASGSDTLDDLEGLSYSRVAGLYHPSPAAMFAARLNGRCLPFDPGGETWALKTLDGIDAPPMTSTHRANLVAKNATALEEVGDLTITFGGTTGDADFIDVRRGLDWLDDDMSSAVFEVLVGSSKVAYTDDGISAIEGAIRGSLKRAETLGIITSDWAVVVPLASAATDANKAARLLAGVKFSATLAGAIHKVNINGSISV